MAIERGIVRVCDRTFILTTKYPQGEAHRNYWIMTIEQVGTNSKINIASERALEKWFEMQNAYAAMRATHKVA